MLKILLFLIIVTATAINAPAESFGYDFCIDGIYYTILSKDGPCSCEVAKAPETTCYSGEMTIPASLDHDNVTYSVISIGEMAFVNCDGLTSVTIPETVTSIGPWAFSLCSNLVSVNIPNSVTSICTGAFDNCSSLLSVTIPNSVTYIGNYAFAACSSLSTVTIPGYITSFGEHIFLGCNGIEAFYGIYASADNRCLIVDEALYAFAPKGLTTYIIPESVTSIGNEAFAQSIELTSVTIPETVTSIGYSAFSDCSGLTSVTIPNSVSSIGDFAFGWCTGMTSVTVENNNPSNISLGNKVFFDVNTSSCTLYVPKGSKDLYAAADQWSDFGKIEESESASVHDPITDFTDPENTDGVYYDLLGRRVKSPTSGIYIHAGKKVLAN